MRQRNSGRKNFGSSEKFSPKKEGTQKNSSFSKEKRSSSSFRRDKDENSSYEKRGEKKSFGRGPKTEKDSDRRYSDRPKKSFDSFGKSDKPFVRGKKRFSDDSENNKGFDKGGYRSRGERGEKGERSKFGSSSKDSFNKPDKPFVKGKKRFSGDSEKNQEFDRSYNNREEKGKYSKTTRTDFRSNKSFSSRSRKYQDESEEYGDNSFGQERKKTYEKRENSYRGSRDAGKFQKKKSGKKESSSTSDDGTIRLNRYIANAGICSRREADVFISSGVVTVNGKTITEMGYRVKPGDVVTYDGAPIRNERKVYLLLNKPKDYITTTDDPQERRTVMELVKGACRERLYPVGRLDRNTTGLLLFTNDGDLAAKLTHPKHNIKKLYHVSLNKKIKPDDFLKLTDGIELEDGFIKPDVMEFVGEGRKDIGIEIHSGRNRIVRRMFEQLGYEVVKLDRVTFAGLTKKDIGRGKWRFLNQKEINFLKML